MKLKIGKLSIALICIYVACMIFTAYTLFQLQDDLIYKTSALNISMLSTAEPIFIKLFVVVGLTLLVGLAALVVSFDNRTQEVVYVEEKNTESTGKQAGNGYNSDEDGHSLDLNAIKTIVASENDKKVLAKELLMEVCRQMEAGMGAFYKVAEEGEKRVLSLESSYALSLGESQTITFEFGEGLVGQAAVEQKSLLVDDIPEGYVKIVSGLGKATPSQLLIVPVKHKNELYGIVEIASFTTLGKQEEKMVEEAFKQFIKALTAIESEANKTYPLGGSSKGKSSK